MPPQGVAGGRPGASGAWIVNDGTNHARRLAFAIGDVEPLEPGDTVTHYTPGGGGYGPPRDRPVERVLRDLAEGLITVDHALREYGVRVDPRTLEVLEVVP